MIIAQINFKMRMNTLCFKFNSRQFLLMCFENFDINYIFISSMSIKNVLQNKFSSFTFVHRCIRENNVHLVISNT